MPFEIIKQDITKMNVDAIVNPTSSNPSISVGNEYELHHAAGPALFAERHKFGYLEKTKAIITHGYNLAAKYVIHVARPIHIDGKHNEQDDLYQTYINALYLAEQYHIESIGLPLISSETNHFPRGKALKIALLAIKSFLDHHNMYIYLIVNDESSYQISLERFVSISNYLEFESTDEVIFYKNDEEYLDFKIDPISIKTSSSISRSLESINIELDESFAETLFRLIDERELNDIEVYKKANIDRKLFSKIKSNMDYQPSKLTAIAFSIALELNIDQTKDLLNKAGYSLSPSSKFDKIIYYFIENKIYDLYEINQVLFAFEQKTIGGLD